MLARCSSQFHQLQRRTYPVCGVGGNYLSHRLRSPKVLFRWIILRNSVVDVIATGMKWWMIVILALGTLSAPLSSSGFSGSLRQIESDFDVGLELGILSVWLFVVGFAIGPMAWAPVAELTNIQTLLMLRFFAGGVFRDAIARPWVLLFFEPIVLVLSIYASIIYGTLYLTFTAFPIIFGQERQWSQGIAGLSYLGIMTGQFFAMLFYIVLETQHRKAIAKDPTKSTPEARLAPAMIGGVLLPISLFWFAWNTLPNIHRAVSIVGSSFFGFGQVLLFISLINYMIDAYTVFSSSALASSVILRALFGAAFPLFTPVMYQNLGVQ
ncbi:hypothetical protein F4813DRAFT_389591 [Daldinia decipiens]|uniref:uncharacterized protein n=1 Tax=Daldinia decipiens TaxID=326647 RepID=UPI0020C3CEBD|nr:uncharacterized protein F4813DRAFT_389591 [Daldinia decipiens]KAI1657412.1 hypothetical protein F4813DRAFT_389591 [Daldinia decipiens]